MERGREEERELNVCKPPEKDLYISEHTAAATVIYKLHKVVFIIFWICFNNCMLYFRRNLLFWWGSFVKLHCCRSTIYGKGGQDLCAHLTAKYWEGGVAALRVLKLLPKFWSAPRILELLLGVWNKIWKFILPFMKSPLKRVLKLEIWKTVFVQIFAGKKSQISVQVACNDHITWI